MNVTTIGASGANYTVGRGGKKVEWIVVHYTATSASAYNNCVYFARAGAGASAHYFVDDSGVYASVPENSTAWAAGNFDVNQRSINIEVVSAGEPFSDAEVGHLAQLVADLMSRHGLPSWRVIRHYDVADIAKVGYTSDPHKHCPRPYVNDAAWNALLARITGSPDAAGDVGTDEAGKLVVDGYWGTATTTRLQEVLGTPVDGEIWHQIRSNVDANGGLASGWKCDGSLAGSECVRAMQRLLGVDDDGLVGPVTIKALQKRMGTPVDGVLDEASPCIKEMQRRLNKGEF